MAKPSAISRREFDGKDPTPKVIVPAPTAPKKESAQDRINKAVRAQRTAERELAAERQKTADFATRLERIEKGLSPAPLTKPAAGATTVEVDPGAPDPAKYQFGDLDPRYLADLARHSAKTIIEADKTEQAKARQTAEQRAAVEAYEASKAKLVADALADFPDFQEVVMDSAVAGEWDLTKVVGDLAFESAQGPAIMYHLATNVDESKTLAKLTPAKQAAWFGKMEAFFAAKYPPKPSGAANGTGGAQTVQPAAKMTSAPPVPERRVRGNGNPNPVSPDTTDFAAFERLAKSTAH